MNNLSTMTREQLEAMVTKLSTQQAARVSFKVTSEKTDRETGKVKGKNGALSMYGLGQFPTTLYVSQWERIIEAVKSGALERFIEANAHLLTRKQ